MTGYDTIVIGAGLAGMTTACGLAQAGQKVLVLAKGLGALLLASGCVDVLGFQPADSLEPVSNPSAKLADFVAARPDHPYAWLGPETIESGLTAFMQLVQAQGLDYRGDFRHNWRLPGAIGAVHPTCLAPASLAAGDLSRGGRWLIVGFSHLRDFYPALLADNLNRQNLGVQAEPVSLELSIPLASPLNATPLELARAFEQPEFRRQVIQSLSSRLKSIDRVGFPAVLGLDRHQTVLSELEKGLGKPVFEISALPPSVPGRRLFEALKAALFRCGGRLIVGSPVVDGAIVDGKVTHIRFETASRLKTFSAGAYVLATGGIFGGGLIAQSDGRVTEPIFDLPVATPDDRHHWFDPRFVAAHGQPVSRAGLTVAPDLRPRNGSPAPLAANLYAAGALLAGADWVGSRSGDGLSLACAAAIVKYLTQ